MNHDETPMVAVDESEPLLIAADDVARMMGVSPRTVWRLLSSGQLIAPLRLGGNTRWRRAEVIEWIAKGCPRPASDQ